MHNPVDSQPITPTLSGEESLVQNQHAASPAAAKARKPFVEPTVSAATDVLEVTQNFAQVTGSGNIPL